MNSFAATDDVFGLELFCEPCARILDPQGLRLVEYPRPIPDGEGCRACGRQFCSGQSSQCPAGVYDFPPPPPPGQLFTPIDTHGWPVATPTGLYSGEKNVDVQQIRYQQTILLATGEPATLEMVGQIRPDESPRTAASELIGLVNGALNDSWNQSVAVNAPSSAGAPTDDSEF